MTPAAWAFFALSMLTAWFLYLAERDIDRLRRERDAARAQAHPATRSLRVVRGGR
jgi:hypothetical protein